MYPDYRDKPKLFLNILIVLDDNNRVYIVHHSQFLQHVRKRRNKKSLCKSGVVQG